MQSLAAAAVMVLLATSGASALCVSRPDDAATGYTRNTTEQAVCLQRELAQETARAADDARIEAALGNLQIELQRQQQWLTLQLSQQPWPQPQF
ncbi:MAG TPA: hypothetical protein GYA10_08615 [Alphaproteobacteria bacterium]|nr:hypothetical protein [Alphaproteobacteria bacterium]